MSSVLDVVEEVIGKLTHKRVELLERCRDQRWLEELWMQLRTLPETDLSGAVPAKGSDTPTGYIRPYFPTFEQLPPVSDTQLPELRLDRFAFEYPPDLQEGKQQLARLLLYSDSVAIDDPIWWLVCYDLIGFKQFSWIVGSLLEKSRPRILEGLHFLSEYRPLIKSGRLVLVPPSIAAAKLTQPLLEPSNHFLEIGNPKTIEILDLVPDEAIWPE